MGINLYQLVKQIHDLAEVIEAADDNQENMDSFCAALSALEIVQEEKLAGVAALIKNWKAEQEAVNVEQKRLRERARVIENRVERLKQWVAYCFPDLDWTNGVHKLSYRKSVETQVDPNVDFSQWPAEYVRTKVIHEPIKDALKRDLKAGCTIPFARLVEHKNLQCK